MVVPSANSNEGEEEDGKAESTTTSDGGGGDGDSNIAAITSDSTTVAVKKTWKRTMPKKKKNGHGNAKQSTKNKSRAQYNAEVAAAAAAAVAIAVDNQPVATETTDPALPLAKPPSQLIRMIASRNNTIKCLKAKRKASDDKVAALQVELKKARHELHRDRKVSRQLIVDAEREGVKMMATANSTMTEAQSTINSMDEARLQLKEEYTQQLREERQYWNDKLEKQHEKLDERHKSDCAGYEAIMAHDTNKHAIEKSQLKAKFEKQLVEKEGLVAKEKSHVEVAVSEVEKIRTAAHVEKMQQRQRVQGVYDLNAELREENERLRVLADEAEDKLKTITKAKETSEKKVARVSELAEKRKEKLVKAISERDEAKDLLAEEYHHSRDLEQELEKNATANSLQVKRGRAKGKKGGSDQWSEEVRLWIWEDLCNGIAPSAIPGSIQSAHCRLRKQPLTELPSTSFIREQRIPMQVANTILAAYKLGKATKWTQLYIDGTSRRQTSFQNLIIDVEYEDGSKESIIVSSGIFSEDETAGVLMETIMEHVSCRYYNTNRDLSLDSYYYSHVLQLQICFSL